ncbi:hypothetical protein BGY98DRAFT_242130 [Russula aff. rugulosa BPL654]|nr:hypothetical protein BGY98DRAFT_242130 [Russula aff. rugulosa BPL654]
MNSNMKLSVNRRCPRGCQSDRHSDYWCQWVVRPETRIKGRPNVHIPSSPSPLLPSLRSSPSIVDLCCCRWLPWHAGHIEVSIFCCHAARYLLYTCCIPPPLRVEPPIIWPVAHHARLCFYTQVSHITAETVLCSSRGVGEGGGRGEAGVDTKT